MHIGINALLLKGERSGTTGYIDNLIKALPKVDSENKYTIFTGREKSKSNLTRIAWENIFFNNKLKKNNIDLLHSTSFISPPRCPVKTVVTLHDLAYFLYPDLIPKAKVFYYKCLIPDSIFKARRIIAVSENLKNEIVNFFKVDKDKVEVIYYGVEEIFKPIDKERAKKEVFERFGIKDKFILFVGKIRPRKNLETLLEAFYFLDKKIGKRYKLVVAGPWGWLYKEVLRRLKRFKLGEKCVFTGYVDSEDLLYLYNASDLLVYPSIYEGFGLPVLEAFACGVPVITSNNSSLPEISGGAAILVNPKNSNELLEKMITVLEDGSLQKELRRKGIDRVREFSWLETAKRTIRVYENSYRDTL